MHEANILILADQATELKEFGREGGGTAIELA